MGTRLMDSVPPARMTSAWPSMMRSAAMRDGLQAGGAEAVDSHGRDLDGQTGAQRGDARDVHALLGFGHGAAEDDVVDLFGVEARHAVDGGADGDGGQIIRARRAQGALAGLADSGANGTDNYGVFHGLTSFCTASCAGKWCDMGSICKVDTPPTPPVFCKRVRKVLEIRNLRLL